jgi:hypothetical protein
VFGDTKHRMVNYSAVATTRFQDYFVQTVQLTLSTGSPVTVNAAGIVEQSEVLRNVSADPKADSTITYTRGVDYDVDYAAGTITARTPLGSQAVHIAYVAPPVTRSSTERPLPAPIDVLSTARPAAPRVLYVVPTFGWSHSTTTTGQSSGRSGNGLRVYLDRPWWSTGQDEQLAVIALPAGAASPPPDNLAPLVTLWGRDPIWKTGSLAAAPKAADFPSAATVAHDVHLAEIGETVDVAAHDVTYDSQRGVWFADVTVDTGAASYSPFIRLALARYQAHSLPNYNIELSSVVLAEFTKLSPDRTASVAYAGNPTTVNVSVNGLANTGGAFGDDTTLVTVVVETALDGVQGELGWVASTLPAVQLGASPGPNGTTTWSGPVALPTSRGHGPMRLVIREYELYATDPDSPTIDTTAGRRLVYVDTIEI